MRDEGLKPARLLAVVLALSVAVTGCGSWRWPGRPEPPPSYHLVVWDYRQPLAGADHLYGEYLAHVLEDYTRDRPHITVELRILHLLEGEDQLQKALAAGQPPDVYGTVWADGLPAPSHLVPAGTAADLAGFWPAATTGLARDGLVWGWPRWLWWDLWAVNRQAWPASELDRWQRHGWTWDALPLAVGGARLGLDLTAAWFWQAATGAAATPEVLAERVAALVPVLEQLVAQGALGRDLERTANTRIEDFYQGRVAALAPVTPYLARYLRNRLETRTNPPAGAPRAEDLVLLPYPALRPEPNVPWRVSAYFVFRRDGPDADGRAAAAAELAAYLARRMGRWGAEHLGVVPGWREDLRYWSVHSGLDHGLRVAMAATLERTLGPVWLPEEAAFWERAYHEVLPAVVRDVLGGRKPPPDFAYWLVTHLRQLRD